ncbi:MAG: hypothetical protein KAJ51_09195, partial [Thermoplasmata archaeon]|nr:hypothetical protein [Thermoplasmata archaeon]
NDTNGAGSAEPDIFYRCNLTGSSWEDIQVISEPIYGNNINTGWSSMPEIAVINGKNHIFWEDANDTSNAGPDKDIFYRYTNYLPFLSQGSVTPTFGDTSTLFNYTVTYTDSDNDTPTEIKVNIDGTNHSMMPANPGDTNYLDGNTYYYKTTLGIGSGHTYQFWTSDGIHTNFTPPVNEPNVYNTPPTIITPDNTTAIEDLYYEVDYEYEDIDQTNVGQVGNWSLVTDAEWLEFNTTTGILYGLPTNDDVGSYWVNNSINDTMDIDYTNFSLSVQNVNDPPIITTTDLTSATEDVFYEVTFDAEDIDLPPQTLFWTIKTNASWLTVNTTLAKITGTPTNDDVGNEFWVDVTVNDGESSNQRNFTLEVTNVNDPPVIITESVTIAYVDELYSVDYDVIDIDPNGDILTWALATDAKSWLTMNATTGVLRGTPSESDVGEYWVNVSINDGQGGTDYHNFTLTVEPWVVITNLDPDIITTDVTTANVDILYSVTYEATDDRTPVANLTWVMNTNATWLNFNTITGILSGTPVLSDLGRYWVNISVSDGEGGFVYHNFTIIVTKSSILPPTNTKPELSNGGMSPASGDEDTLFTFSVDYTDEDGNPPT